jgi:hypothetical protein
VSVYVWFGGEVVPSFQFRFGTKRSEEVHEDAANPVQVTLA